MIRVIMRVNGEIIGCIDAESRGTLRRVLRKEQAWNIWRYGKAAKCKFRRVA